MATIQVMLIKHTIVVNHYCDKMKKICDLTGIIHIKAGHHRPIAKRK